MGCRRAFVVPAFNEEANLPRLFDDLEAHEHLVAPDTRVLIVDDGSCDRTAELALAYEGPMSVECLSLESNQGPGAAFRQGFLHVLDELGDDGQVVTLEADTTSDLGVLPEMIERADAGADVVLASVHGGGRMIGVSRRRRVLSAGAAVAMRAALGVDAATVSSFFRVYRAAALRDGFRRYGDGFVRERGFACKAEILAKLVALGASVEEVPVDLDASLRIGPSKMSVLPTVVGYGRLAARQWVGRA